MKLLPSILSVLLFFSICFNIVSLRGCSQLPSKPLVVKRIPLDRQQLAAAMTVELTGKLAGSGYSPGYISEVVAKTVQDTYGEVVVIETNKKAP